MLVINQEEASDLLSIAACIKVMETALTDLARGEAVQELRSVVPIEQGNVLGQMPGYLKKAEVLGTKIITVFPDNYKIGLASHQGVVLIFNARNGQLKAIVDGTKITAIRTAAVSAVATNLLAKENSEKLSILGTGEQARSHLEAMLLVRPIKEVRVWSRQRENGLLFKEEMKEKFAVPIKVCDTAEDAVHDTDIICTVTSSTVPILKGAWVKEGTHINAVGACQANHRELDTQLVQKSSFYVDLIESARNESGDYLIPLKEGAIQEDHIVGEIGAALTKEIEGRKSEACITVFKSLGLAIEDLAAANFIYEEALRLSKGITIQQGGKRNGSV